MSGITAYRARQAPVPAPAPAPALASGVRTRSRGGAVFSAPKHVRVAEKINKCSVCDSEGCENIAHMMTHFKAAVKASQPTAFFEENSLEGLRRK